MIYIQATEINYLAVLFAAILNMGLGFAWYSPQLFGSQWLKEVGLKKESTKNPGPMFLLLPFAGALIMNYVLAHFVAYAGGKNAIDGIITGVWAALGFVATTTLVNYLFAGKSKELYLIDVGYHLIGLVLSGAILGAWR